MLDYLHIIEIILTAIVLALLTIMDSRVRSAISEVRTEMATMEGHIRKDLGEKIERLSVELARLKGQLGTNGGN